MMRYRNRRYYHIDRGSRRFSWGWSVAQSPMTPLFKLKVSKTGTVLGLLGREVALEVFRMRSSLTPKGAA